MIKVSYFNSKSIAPRATIGRNERLKSRKIIEGLFKEGRSVAAFPVRVTWKLLETGEHTLQAGFSASSRNFKKAVDRNRIKRLLREVYRKQKADLVDQLSAGNKRLAVFIIFTGKEIPDYLLVEEKMMAALKKLRDQLNIQPMDQPKDHQKGT